MVVVVGGGGGAEMVRCFISVARVLADVDLCEAR
jgi:hypothetical protein